jgi:predicted transcriptional regulator
MANVDPFFDELDSEAEGLADIAAGRVISHADVMAWLATWGTPEEEPAPEHWFK